MFNPRSTIVRQVSAERPDWQIIAEAAAVLRRGGLVAFPTETVYGLGASALDASAVESIFAAKGRPANNPVIVHVADIAGAKKLVSDWPEAAVRLAEKFWPGSLTLVLSKRPEIPDVVTAGGSTVGVRVPAHPVALALLQAAQLPIAAPSANRSTQISPTTAEHVRSGLDGRIDMILDAGPTPGGLESTVLDLTVDPPRLLRPGLVTIAQLEAAIGQIDAGNNQSSNLPPSEPLRSPGLQQRHYAPRARVLCFAENSEPQVQKLQMTVNRIGWLQLPANGELRAHDRALNDSIGNDENIMVIEMPTDASGYSAKLYAALHELDAAGMDVIVVDLPPTGSDWLAVHDRLRRAAAQP